MPWTTPATWVAGQVLGATDLNTQLRDNLNYLFSQRSNQVIKRDNNADYTMASSTFVDIDGTNLSITLTINSGKALVWFAGNCTNSGGTISWDILIDGTRYASGGSNGLSNVSTGPIILIALVLGLSVGSHTFKPQWKITANVATLYAGAGVGPNDVIPTFAVMEIG